MCEDVTNVMRKVDNKVEWFPKFCQTWKAHMMLWWQDCAWIKETKKHMMLWWKDGASEKLRLKTGTWYLTQELLMFWLLSIVFTWCFSRCFQIMLKLKHFILSGNHHCRVESFVAKGGKVHFFAKFSWLGLGLDFKSFLKEIPNSQVQGPVHT